MIKNKSSKLVKDWLSSYDFFDCETEIILLSKIQYLLMQMIPKFNLYEPRRSGEPFYNYTQYKRIVFIFKGPN